MIRTGLFLMLWLSGVFVSVTCAVPATVPGQGNPLAALIALGLLVTGAWLEAGKCRWKPIFFIYGCLGGLPFILLFYPDHRALLSQAMNPSPTERASDWAFTIACIVGVLSAGVVCRFVAHARHQRDRSRHVDSTRCRKCGYLLRGLPEPRCPECGTPIEREDKTR